MSGKLPAMTFKISPLTTLYTSQQWTVCKEPRVFLILLQRLPPKTVDGNYFCFVFTRKRSRVLENVSFSEAVVASNASSILL